eukprot:TRINITY_DN5184_c0_g1_i1.p3 TRINITY_DN5184_c0_g1~~TRINITY_DN5184_c0_g1_i1.p3  ORF type:complete len:412 (-),score=107.31 TRINITY_DN5184_c0_g1_i1:35-1270(-)
MAEEVSALFEFNVSEPEKKEKQGALDFAYWTYHVYTKTTLETFSQKELVCVRRYNDFVWLRDQLVEAYQGVIVPPIPEKSIKGSLEKVISVNANPLLEYRQRALRKFLVRVGAHPILCTSDLLREFLELSPEDFAKRKEAPKKKAEVNLGQRFKELSFTVSKSFAGPGTAGAGTASAEPEKEVETTTARALDTNWEETKNYIDQLERSLVLLKERIELLVKRRRDTSVSLSEFGKSFVKVGEIESSYEEGTLPKALIDVGHHSEHLSIVYQEQADNETIQVVETILYYIGLTTAVREVIKRIQKMALTRDTIEDSLVKLQEKRGKLAGKEEELRKLDLEINNTNQRKEEASQAVAVVDNTFREELRRFHREKQYDIKQMLKAFVDLQLEYAAKMKTSWESVLPSVEAIKTE